MRRPRRRARCRRPGPRGSPRSREHLAAPASSRRRIVRRPCARSSRCCAGMPETARRAARRHGTCTIRPPTPHGVPAPSPEREPGRCCPKPLRDAARHLADQSAYVTAARLVRELRRARPPVRRASPSDSPRRGVGTGDVVALVLPPGPEYLPSPTSRPRSSARSPPVSTTGCRPRERDAVLGLAEPRLVLAAPGFAPDGLRARRDRDRPRRRRDVLAAAAGRRRGAPAARPTTPTGRSRSSSRRARPGSPKGALYCNRQLSFITQTDVGDTWGGGGTRVQRARRSRTSGS